MSKRDIFVPDPVVSDTEATAIMGAWLAKKTDSDDPGMHISLFIPSDWKDPGMWGIVLADFLCHLVRAYGDLNEGVEPSFIQERILDLFNREIELSTSPKTGETIQTH